MSAAKSWGHARLFRRPQAGFTLVELMVAMAVGLLISLAAIAGLISARRGFSTVDAASQLRDNGRFSVDLIRRLGVQSGFKDRLFAAAPVPPPLAGAAANPPPNIYGFNNASLNAKDPLTTANPRAAGSEGYGSDILILRYQTAERFPGADASDQSMIDCSGDSPKAIPANRYDRVVSVFHVDLDRGEPSLMCTYSPTGAAPFTTVPVVRGVENFQVLYGTDGVSAGKASAATNVAGSPNAFLRADELVVSGDQAGTNSNWRRVRSLRIGMILRGPRNSAQERAVQRLFPFGAADASGNRGSGMASANDPGTVFDPPADGRLRQVVTFTVHLRNDQGL